MATEISYNGAVIGSLESGQTATLACAGKKAVGNIAVAFDGAGNITHNGSTTAVESGKTATLQCAGKKMTSDVYVTVQGGGIPDVGSPLEDFTWEQISAISAAGKGEEYFKIGDTKSVHLSGIVGTLPLDITLYVYIIGFNHNSALEGNGITFGTFKTADGADVALIDSKLGYYNTDGTKYFNMSHWGRYNYGSWDASDLRYDILGSTDVAPSDYGSAKTSSSVGYDATATCATNPVENTLMAALPAELRAVLKPMVIYTDNVAGGSGDVEGNISATIDYLPLLAEYEISGTRKYANTYEQNKQAQYEYFANGNSKVKYRHSATDSTAFWWFRSPLFNIYSFCGIDFQGGIGTQDAYRSFGIAPIFRV